MDITWLGHSSFIITSKSNKKILLDPFDPVIGYCYKNFDVDIATISHNHFDHNYIEKLTENTIVINEAKEFEIDNIYIKGFKSFHDNINGKKRGENIIFLIKIDGFSICHLGDLGHPLSNSYYDELKNTDILFVPVGGNFTLNAKEASKVCKHLNSKIIIPMHYKTKFLTFQLNGVEDFLIHMRDCETINSDTIHLNSSLDCLNQVKLLSL